MNTAGKIKMLWALKKSHTIGKKQKNSKSSEEDGPCGEPTVGTQHRTI